MDYTQYKSAVFIDKTNYVQSKPDTYWIEVYFKMPLKKANYPMANRKRIAFVIKSKKKKPKVSKTEAKNKNKTYTMYTSSLTTH